MSNPAFDPQTDDLTLYHNGDLSASTAQLLDDALEAASAAAGAAASALPRAAQLANVDMNEMRTTGFFHGFGTVNAPEEGFMYFQVIAYPDGYNYWVKQLAYSFQNNKLYIRTMANGLWTEWELIPTGDVYGTISALAAEVAAAKEQAAAATGSAAVAATAANSAAATANEAKEIAQGAAPANHTHSQYLTSVPQYSSTTGDSLYVCGPNRNHKTLQSLVDSLPKFAIGVRRLQVDAGDYPEKVVLKGFHGAPIQIETSSAYSGRANILGILPEDCTATIIVSGVNIGPAGGQNPSHGVYPTRCGVVKVEGCNIQSVAFGIYAVRTDKIVVRNTVVSAIGGNLSAAIGMGESEGTIVALDGLTVNGGFGSTAIHAHNAVILGKRPAMNSVDVELNSNGGGVVYNVI